MRTNLLVAVFVVGMAAGASHALASEMRVKVGRFDPADPAAAAALDRRIDQAAKRFCDRELIYTGHMGYRDCIDGAQRELRDQLPKGR